MKKNFAKVSSGLKLVFSSNKWAVVVVEEETYFFQPSSSFDMFFCSKRPFLERVL
jgi:hypothetical protein